MLVISIIAAVFSPAAAAYAIAFVNQEKLTLRTPFNRLKRGQKRVHYIGLYILLPAFYILFYILKLNRSAASDLFNILNIQGYILLFFMAVIAVIDYEQKKIPNMILVYMLIAWALTMAPQIGLDVEAGFSQLVYSILGLLLGGGLFSAVYIISRKNIGGGDVKLIAVVGLYVAVHRILPVIFYGTLLAAVVGFALILFGKLTKKDSIPLSPFLFIGAYITLLITN